MKNIAYLCSQVTLPGSPIRRSDAFEHDRTMDAFRPEFEKRGLTLHEVSWDDATAEWNNYDAVIIGTAWDYWDRSELFLETLDQIESQTKLFNSSSLVRWNSNKRYLKDFETHEIRLIPTQWIDSPSKEEIARAFGTLDCDDMVVKRQVGAGADGQFRLTRGETVPEMPYPMMAQPFLSAIETEGELSLIFIDGQFSHALVKRAVEGDYRIQSSYGGTEHATSPSEDDKETARKVLQVLDETPLYARVDMLRGDSGELFLMELELIEPYLYPVEGPELGRRMAEAVALRLE